MRLILLFLLSSQLYAQQVTKTEMWVTSVFADTVIKEFRVVKIGFHRDEMCLDIGYLTCFSDMKVIYRPNEPTHPGQDIIAEAKGPNGEPYTIRQVATDDGITIFIINSTRRPPHYMLSTHKPYK